MSYADLNSVENPQEERTLVYGFNPIGVKETALGSYLFDYFEKVPTIFKTYFLCTAASIKAAMKGFLTYHYFKITRIESKEDIGLICFGCKSSKEISIVHLSVISESDFEKVLSDTKMILLREFPVIHSISLLVNYPKTEVRKNLNGYTFTQPQTIWEINPKVLSILKKNDFSLKYIESGVNFTKRLAGFMCYRKTFTVTMKDERLVLPVIPFDPKAVNVEFRLALIISNNVITKVSPKQEKVYLQTEFGQGLPETFLEDIRSPILAIIACYAQLYSKWNKHDFNVPDYNISLKDLAACKSKISKLKVGKSY